MCVWHPANSEDVRDNGRVHLSRQPSEAWLNGFCKRSEERPMRESRVGPRGRQLLTQHVVCNQIGYI